MNPPAGTEVLTVRISTLLTMTDAVEEREDVERRRCSRVSSGFVPLHRVHASSSDENLLPLQEDEDGAEYSFAGGIPLEQRDVAVDGVPVGGFVVGLCG